MRIVVPSLSLAAILVARPAHAAGADREGEKGLSIGAGWTFPTTILEPNTVSARLRAASGLALEPSIHLAAGSAATKVETEDADAVNETAITDVVIGTAVRKPMADARDVWLVAIGGASLGYGKVEVVTDSGDTVTTTSTTAIDLFWGAGLELPVREVWTVGFDATNPLVTYTSTVTDVDVDPKGGDTTTTVADRTIGLIFDPTVRFMVHLDF